MTQKNRIFKFRKIISNRETCQKLVRSDHPIYIDRKLEQTDTYCLYEGHFYSPLVDYLSDLVPNESHIAYFQLIVPSYWNTNYLSKQIRPLCVQIAGTGDHVSFHVHCCLLFLTLFSQIFNQKKNRDSGVVDILWPNH